MERGVLFLHADCTVPDRIRHLVPTSNCPPPLLPPHIVQRDSIDSRWICSRRCGRAIWPSVAVHSDYTSAAMASRCDRIAPRHVSERTAISLTYLSALIVLGEGCSACGRFRSHQPGDRTSDESRDCRNASRAGDHVGGHDGSGRRGNG